MIDSPLRRQLVGVTAALLPYLEDDRVTDVVLNGPGSFFVEREGALSPEPHPLPTVEALRFLVERLCLPLGRRIDAAQPFLDGHLADGSRFHLLLPPVATDGPYVSIRCHRKSTIVGLQDFAEGDLLLWLERQVRERKNLLVCGGTGAGKTTLVSALLAAADVNDRILVVEESRELRPQHRHVLTLEARPPTPDGIGAVTLRQLLRASLRMRPDRLVLGECRGEEAFELVQALNTGHRGSMGTIHGNGCSASLRRLEGLVLLGCGTVSPALAREWVATAFDAVVFVARTQGQRRVEEAWELRGLEGGTYRFHPVFPKVLRPRDSVPFLASL